MLWRCAKGIIAEIPINLMLLPKMSHQRQFFKRKNAFAFQKRLEAFGEENIRIEIKAAQRINGEVTKEIVALNIVSEIIEHGPVLREALVYKGCDRSVVEKAIFEI